MRPVRVKVRDSNETMSCECVRLPRSVYEQRGRIELFAPDGYSFDNELNSLLSSDMDELKDRITHVRITPGEIE